MPGKRIKDLTALSGAGSANNDDVVIFDADADVTKRISRSQLAEGMQSDVQVFSNKTINLGSNTLTGTTAQFNTALSDNNFATQAGSETLTNKTIDSATNTLTVNYKEARVETSDASRTHLFTTVAALLADTGTYTTYAAGQIVEAGGFRYEVAASGATDHHVTTAGGVKLYVLPVGGAYNIRAFGAVGDGVTNDASAIQGALNTGKSVCIPTGAFYFTSSLNFTADGQSIFGSGNDCVLKSGTGAVYINTQGFDNLAIRSLKLVGTGTNGGIRIVNDSQNFEVQNVYFFEGQQRVWLWECDHVKVQNCTFDSTGYGVIAQTGYSSSYVLVDGNIAMNMENDFVEANQAAATTSEFWSITNNVFTGSAGYPTPATESRFVGITRVRGCIIANNTVKKTAGDSAIHLEDAFGETVISGNVFDNCIQSGGNAGYIYLLNSAENTIIANNVFMRTDNTLAQAYALDLSSNVYSNSVQFVNNLVLGTAAGSNLSGVFVGFQSHTLISGNVFQALKDGVLHANASFVSVVGNRFRDCESGIRLARSNTSNGGSDWLVSDNVFTGTTGTYDLYTQWNNFGTGAPKRWTILSNVFAKQAFIEGLGGGTVGSSSDAEDITISNNVFVDGATLYTGGTMSRLIRFGNVFHNATLGGGVPLVQGLPDYANDTAAAAGGIPIGGLYRNGSVVQVRVT